MKATEYVVRIFVESKTPPTNKEMRMALQSEFVCAAIELEMYEQRGIDCEVGIEDATAAEKIF